MRALLVSSLLFVACANQPAPECQVQAEPYLAVLTRTNEASPCAEPLQSMDVSLSRFGGAGAAPFAVAVRASRAVDLAKGRAVESKTLTVNTTMPRHADTNEVCAVADVALETTLPAAVTTAPDGGALDVPALTVRYAWRELKLRMTSGLGGAVFTGKLTRFEGSCADSYDVTAVSPKEACLADIDCAASKVEGLLGSKQLRGVATLDGGLRVPDAGVTTYQQLVRGALVRAVARQDGNLLRFEDNTVATVDTSGVVQTPDGGVVAGAQAPGAGFSAALEMKCDSVLHLCVPTSLP